jgi:hypothetical protein
MSQITAYGQYNQGESASLRLSGSTTVTADTLTVTNGTISSGDVTTTQTLDGTNLVVNESGQFQIEFDFTLTNHPVCVSFDGRYQGNVAHNVKIYAYNYDTTAYVALTADSQDFISRAANRSYVFQFPSNNEDYYNSGAAKIKIEHLSASVGSHNFYTDYIALIQESLDLPTPGTAVALTGMTEGNTFQTTVSGTNGTITVPDAGDWEVFVTIGSFVGPANSNVKCHLFVDGVENTQAWISRGFGSTINFGSAIFSDTYQFNGGEVLTARFTCDIPNGWVSIQTMTFRLRRA